MQRYENGKIYKMVNDVDDNIYVGSTCLSLAKRIYQHRALSKIKVKRLVYEKLNQIGWDNVHIILVESFPCENKMELLKRERHHIDLLKPKLNKSMPMRIDEEVKQTKQKSSKKYYETHQNDWKKRRQTEEYKAYQKAYREKARQKQSFNKTISYMESTIKQCQSDLLIETSNSNIGSFNWNLSDLISH